MGEPVADDPTPAMEAAMAVRYSGEDLDPAGYAATQAQQQVEP
jgi:hypothetical protein